jgi:hypothetical protein
MRRALLGREAAWELILPLAFLMAIHVVVLAAGFFAPYDPALQDRSAPNCPPTRIHWGSADGGTHWRPNV